MFALAKCVPGCHSVSVGAKHIAFHCDTEPQAYALAVAFGIELAYSDATPDGERWLRGSDRSGERAVTVFGPHVRIGEPRPLDDRQVDAALATAAEVTKPAPGPVSTGGAS